MCVHLLGNNFGIWKFGYGLPCLLVHSASRFSCKMVLVAKEHKHKHVFNI